MPSAYLVAKYFFLIFVDGNKWHRGFVQCFLTYQCLYLQTLDIVAENPDKFRVVALAAGSNVTLLADQVINCFFLVNTLLRIEITIL